MFKAFEDFMAAEVKLRPEEISHILALATVRKLKRREILLQEGHICQYKAFILDGLLKTGSVSDGGQEYVLRFNPENSWAVDPLSFSKKVPARFSIDAVERSTVLLWTFPAFEELMTSIPVFKTYMSKLLMDTFYDTHERVKSNISYTSEEKYLDFVNTFPDLLPRLPLHLVAAYLGISRETLSRIRHLQMKRG